MRTISFNAKLFTPGKGISWKITSRRLMNFSWLSFMLIVITSSYFELNAYYDYTVTLTLIILFSLMPIASYWGYHAKEYKYGKLEGYLSITTDGIAINEKIYSWPEIQDLQYKVGHTLNELLFDDILFDKYRYYGGPAYSAGVDSYISFKYNDEYFKFGFRLESPSHLVQYRNLVKSLYYNDYLPLNKTYEGLQLEYEEIQILKEAKRQLKQTS
ncbi:hypothetical protein EV198_1089 [Roseivirga ehrenbergii]|uniref:Uncharacterized protein n=1 Tax=Roseivirga ehrenbergii (strain DSM 102268 / JCM 13514 / KCTC 12282 / NCIMB 14502 / KMM 6017) TaxID=279360 RepID=A0A150X6T1_ROSEK|nr:hypothetical protein [Roseivirga ehrenbergii]KYG74447.1 hypothetical protein MB14_04335 [Roseivirga ehrenbergii]TCL14249.1 hypothetical protein EV198_1089 [Roseivirga ehrenbergii]